MKHLFSSLAALLVLSSCAETGGPVYAGGRPGVVPQSSLVPAHQAAAVARRTPGYVATPAPRFSGAGTAQPTRYYSVGDPNYRSRGNNYYNTSYGNPYYGNPYYGNPYNGAYGSRRYRNW